MNNLIPMANEISTRSKGFWKRPEGRTGTVALVVLAAAAAYFLQKLGVFATLRDAAWTGTQLLWALAALVVSYMFLTSPRVHFLFQATMWHFTNRLIKTLDPAAIMQQYLRQQKGNIDNISERRNKVTGCVKRFEQLVKETRQGVEKATAAVRSAQNDPRFQLALAEASNTYNVLSDELKEYEEQLVLFTRIDLALAKNQEYAEHLFRIIKTRAESILRKRKNMQDVRSVVNSVRALLHGGDFKEFYDIAEERALDEIANDLGYFENLVRETEPLINELELQKKINVETALARINRVESDNAPRLIEFRRSISTDNSEAPIGEPVGQSSGADIFDRIARQ